MKAKRAKADDGTTYAIVDRKVAGEGPCPGEAHGNPWIDNCMLCAPNWGTVPIYEPVDVVDACKQGYAVPVGYVDREAGERAERDGYVRIISLTTHNCNFWGYVHRRE